MMACARIDEGLEVKEGTKGNAGRGAGDDTEDWWAAGGMVAVKKTSRVPKKLSFSRSTTCGIGVGECGVRGDRREEEGGRER
jgi:hypothetical protein